MKFGFLRPQLTPLLLLLAICCSVSVSYGGQLLHGSGGSDGRPTDWDSPSHDSQIFVSQAESAKVKQDPGASGGGEGKPDDWGSPQLVRYFWNFTPSYPLLGLVTDRTFAEILHLISSWE